MVEVCSDRERHRRYRENPRARLNSVAEDLGDLLEGHDVSKLPPAAGTITIFSGLAMKMKVPVSVARYRRTPPEAAKPQGLNSSLGTALRSDCDRSIVVIGNYKIAR